MADESWDAKVEEMSSLIQPLLSVVESKWLTRAIQSKSPPLPG